MASYAKKSVVTLCAGAAIVAVLARAVDRSGDDRTVCTTDAGDVVLTQN
jgi:hypothetical protein